MSMLAPPCIAGDRVTIGHGAVVPGTSAGDGVTIAMGAVVPSRSRVGAGAIVGAGAMVVEEAAERPGALLMGVPTREKGTLSDEERAASAKNAARDVRNAACFRDSPATE